MESTYQIEESTNSSEEIMDHSDQENSDLGVGRSYECVFCKRGFNTAQALGGHMNIHRKDRARNKPNSNSNSNSSTKHEESYSGPRFYEKIPSLGLGFRRLSDPQHHHQPHLDYATYFPSPASSNSTLYESNYDSDRYGPHRTEAVGHDWRMRLGLVEDAEKNQEKELDLELRLGYDS